MAGLPTVSTHNKLKSKNINVNWTSFVFRKFSTVRRYNVLQSHSAEDDDHLLGEDDDDDDPPLDPNPDFGQEPAPREFGKSSICGGDSLPIFMLSTLNMLNGVGGAVRFLVVGTIG